MSTQKCLGRIAPRSDVRTLMARRYLLDVKIPKASNFWTRKAGFSDESWGNDVEGCCTIAKQANMFRRFQRLEHRKTIKIETPEVHRVYRRLTSEKYGGGDTGAYEEDALNCSRSLETCLHDSENRPLLIAGYARLNPYDHEELKRAIWTSAGHGIAICINLPIGFQNLDKVWDSESSTGEWAPGSWGGHSMWLIDYTAQGFILEQTWNMPETLLTYRAAAKYLDEAHMVVDEPDKWDKKIKLAQFIKDVNKVSRTKIK